MEWEGKAQGLRSVKETMDEEWLPQSEGCFSTYNAYQSGKAGSVAACAPNFYPNSCERQCVELQSKDGCGVVEGTRPGAVTGSGGISVPCEPPQPSWILTPFTYNSVEVESQTAQCERIEENQKSRYAQRLLKTGWLWKKGDLRWQKRFFVLESGDDVRSALLRYWDEDPSKNSKADEREGKGIILHDAKSVKEKDGKARYNFKHGEECFKLYHFYRDYRLCVVVPEVDIKAIEGLQDTKAADNLKEQNNIKAQKERDEWLELLTEQISAQ